jgi:hypothetical protein
MSQYTLTVVDTSGIQNYIFGTNQLQQNVGASYLVGCATCAWVVEALPSPHNVIDLDSEKPFTDQAIEDGNLEAEVVYAGGGNTVILFASHDLAVEFARRLTRKVLLEAPGLQVVLVHKNFDWHSHPLGGESGIVDSAMSDLAFRKADWPPSLSLLGLGVTAACVFTGLPAVDEDPDEHRLISAEVKAKLDAEPKAHDGLKALINWHDYKVPKDFDDFGRTVGESSYIAVIHTDGNEMGKRIQRIGEKYSNNREYVHAMRKFSVSVQQAAQSALQATVDKLVSSIQEENGKKVIGDVSVNAIEVRDDKLPFRPIVFGGDDVTFVCDGRLGLSLATYYLEQFSGYRLTDEEPVHCRAGIAVVKTHYPFARAYSLADELCRSAKAYIKERQQQSPYEDGLTAMDWHFAVGGLVRDLKEIRELEYTVPDEGMLLMRPIRLSDPDRDWRSWDTFTQITWKFLTDDERWAKRRNKIKALRDALRTGREAVEHFRAVYGLDELPSIAGQPDMAIRGWQGGRCGYFDAIEAMDFFVPLEGEEQR